MKLSVTLPEPDSKLDQPVPNTPEIIVTDARSDGRCFGVLAELGDIIRHRQNKNTRGRMTFIGYSNV